MAVPLNQKASPLWFVVLSLIVGIVYGLCVPPLTTHAVSTGSCGWQESEAPPTSNASTIDAAGTQVYYDVTDARQTDTNYSGITKLELTYDSSKYTVTGVHFSGATISQTAGDITFTNVGISTSHGSDKSFYFTVTPNAGGTDTPTLKASDNNGYTSGTNETCVSDTTAISWTHATAAPVPGVSTLTGNAGDGTNTLNWTAVTGATSYTLKRGTLSVYTGSNLTYNDTGLTNGTVYSYTVTATNGSGDGAASSALSLTPVAAAPPPPTIQITQRDIQLVSLGLAAYIGVSFIKLFHYRGYD